jgi:hypothetical protein
MDRNLEILSLIKSIRQSFGASIAVYTMGNCYQFYKILKSVFKDAEAYYDGNHVWTKIDGKFYDIRGEKDLGDRRLEAVDYPELIESLSKNECKDEDRKKYKLKENYDKCAD